MGIRGPGYRVVLVGLLLVSACQKKNQTEVKTETKSIPFSERTIQPMASQVRGKPISVISQIFALSTGYSALVLSIVNNSYESVLARLDSNGKWEDSMDLTTEGEVVLSPLESGAYAYAVAKPELDADGGLKSTVDTYRVSLEPHLIEKLQHGVVSLEGGYSATRGWLPLEDLKKIRLQDREMYETFIQYGYPAIFHPQTGEIFLNYTAETVLSSLDGKMKTAIAPWRVEQSGFVGEDNLIPFSGSNTGFAAVTEAKHLLKYYGDFPAPKVPKNSKPDAQVLVLAEVQANGSLGYDTVPVSSSRVWLRACRLQAGKKVCVGSTSADDGETSLLWVGVYDGENLLEASFKLPQKASPTVVEVNEQGSAIVVGGECDYTQARTGSVSHGSGFVLELDESLKLVSATVLRGRRTTSVKTILIEDKVLVVGGYTDGPDTHSEDRTRKGFFLKIPR